MSARPIAVTDWEDPALLPFRALKATNATRGLATFVAEGEKLLERLLGSRFALASVLMTSKHAERWADRLPDGVPLFVATEAELGRIVGFPFHQGVLACAHRGTGPSLRDMAAVPGRRTLVVLPQLDNPENLGAMVRLVDVFGADGVVTGPECPDPFSRRVLRVSMGTALHTPIFIESDLAGTFEDLERFGFVSAAAVADPSARPFAGLPRPERLALVFGREGTGLAPRWERRCTERITIPMRPGADSLNVAVAAGILLHHFA